MRIAVRKNEHIAGYELRRVAVKEISVAAAFGDDVIRDEMLSVWQNARLELTRRDRFDAPRIRGLDGEEKRAVESYYAEEVGESVHAGNNARVYVRVRKL
jgi:hypothetical protein